MSRARAGGVFILDLTKSSDSKRLSHGLQTHLPIEMHRRGRRERIFVVISDGKFVKKSCSITAKNGMRFCYLNFKHTEEEEE